MSGKKYDQGKTRFSLIPYDVLKDIADVLTYGAKKYSARNWEGGMLYSRVYDGAQRHLTDWWEKRMTYDPDGTGLRNIAQATCCLMFLTAYELRGMGSRMVVDPDTGELVKADNRPIRHEEIPPTVEPPKPAATAPQPPDTNPGTTHFSKSPYLTLRSEDED